MMKPSSKHWSLPRHLRHCIDLQLLDPTAGETVSQAPSVRLRHAFATGWHDSVALAFGIFLFFIEEGPSILVWLILLAIPGFFIWRRYRRIRVPANRPWSHLHAFAQISALHW